MKAKTQIKIEKDEVEEKQSAWQRRRLSEFPRESKEIKDPFKQPVYKWMQTTKRMEGTILICSHRPDTIEIIQMRWDSFYD